jgi:hypothetical protein
MKARTIAALVGTLVVSQEASAAYVGLAYELYSVVNVGGPKEIIHIYAYFTDGNDYVTAIAGSSTIGALKIETRNSTDTGPGGNFYNPGGAGSNLAPYSANGMLEWGTFATIGVSFGNQAPGGTDQTSTSPGFPTFISGNSLTSTNIGWFTPGPVEQGRAGWTGDGDNQLRVLIMQLSINAGDNVQGTVAITGVNAGGTPFFAAGETFDTAFCPSPASAAILALAGIAAPRRRRA